MNFDGRKFLVTGGAGGIGQAIVRRLSLGGAQVAATDLSFVEHKEFVDAIPGLVAIEADISKPEEIARLVEEAEKKLGGLDGLVHAAAIGEKVDILDCPVELWDRILAVNFSALFDLCQQVSHSLVRNKKPGVLLALASSAGIRPNACNTPYGVSKAGLIGLMRAIAVDMAPLGIRANVLVPGVTDTPLMRRIAGANSELLKEANMLGRLGLPEEIAEATAFLLSDDASYMTGSVLAADGGFLSAGVRFK